MKKLHVSAELQTTVERAWEIYFDPRFQKEMRTALRIEEFDETDFDDKPDRLRIVSKVTAKRTLPDWVRKIIGDVKVSFYSEDVFNKKDKTMTTDTRETNMPNKIFGKGLWTVRETRPGWVERAFSGEISIDLPLVGGKMEERLAVALEKDFQDINEVMTRWVQRDVEALAAGQPLPEMSPPASVGRHHRD